MSTQATYLTALDQFGDIAQAIDLSQDLAERGADIRDKIADFHVLIPIVGSFNAGKTSLVNAYLQRGTDNGLPTDIVPQTALATEIRSAEAAVDEGIELYGEGDQLLARVGIAEFGRIEKETLKTGLSNARYAKAWLHAEPLAADDRKTLVDMPGLDSGLSTHNAAIQRYLPLGSYFILVVDIEHGALRDSELRQLREFLGREVEFAVLVNKADKKKTDVDAIVGHIREQVQQTLQKEKTTPVHAVSAHEANMAAFGQIVEAVDFDHALRNYWRQTLLALFSDATQSLHTRYSALNVSSAQSEKVIADLEGRKQALEEKLAEDEREIRHRYSARAVDRIVREVRNAIRDQASSLAQTYQAGGKHAFDGEINDLVRQTLNRTLDEVQTDTLREIEDRYQADLDGISAEYANYLDSGVDNNQVDNPNYSSVDHSAVAHLAGDALRKSFEAFRAGRTNFSGWKSQGAWTAVAGIFAATTAVVAPWLEVVIVLLPTLLNFLTERNAEARRRQQQDEQLQHIRTQIGSVAAPRIASGLRETIAKDYDDIAQRFIAGLRQTVVDVVSRIESDIKQSRTEIEEQERNVEERKAQLRDAIGKLYDAETPLKDEG